MALKILVIHNRYVEAGGEDVVVRAEVGMLRDAGCQVILYERSNEELKNLPLFKKIDFLLHGICYSKDTYREITDIIQREKPDIAHIHNIFFVISPAVYSALSDSKVPIVQSIHNYRLFCANGILYRKGAICEKCSTRNFLPAILNRCWKSSFILTFFLARALSLCYKKKIFQEKVAAFVVPAEFCKNKLVQAGLPKDKIFVKPYFTEISDLPREYFKDYALFLGRLVDYKGLRTLLEAYKILNQRHLKIIGDGPLIREAKRTAEKSKNIEVLGRLPYEKVREYLKNAAFLIFPSTCYEVLPMVILEAFACGVPVLARDIGGIREVVKNAENGSLFVYNNSDDLAEKINFLFENRQLIEDMGRNARKTYEQHYSIKENYDGLFSIYRTITRKLP